MEVDTYNEEAHTCLSNMQIVVIFNVTAGFRKKKAIKEIIISNGGIISYIITKKVSDSN